MTREIHDASSTGAQAGFLARWVSRFTPATLGALGVGFLAFVISLARTVHEPSWPTDFDQWYHAAQALLHGGNPYDAVGPTREFKWDWPLNYPLSTVLLTAPLTVFSLPVARVVFATLGGSLLGYALGRDHFRRIGLVLSAAFLIAISRNQWSPFYTAAFFVPWAVLLLVAKPNMTLGYIASVSSWRTVQRVLIVLALLVGISVLVRPSWPREWLGALQQMQYVVAPITRPGGWLFALALFKWRRADARLFLALVCIPQTPSLYDLLPLFVVANTMRQVSILALLTHVLFAFVVAIGPFATFNAYAHALGNSTIFVVYVPVMIMVLLRPNVTSALTDHGPRDSLSDSTSGSSLEVPLNIKQRIEELSRTDAMLLLVNATLTIALFWMSVNTRRV